MAAGESNIGGKINSNPGICRHGDDLSWVQVPVMELMVDEKHGETTMIRRISTGELNLPELELGQSISLLSSIDKGSQRTATM